MDIKYLKNVAVYVISTLLSIGIILYILYHLFGGFKGEIETQNAMYAIQQEKISLDAYIMRNELILYSKSGGGINYLCDDGMKIGVNYDVANIYSGGNGGQTRSMVMQIDKEIEVLKRSNVDDNLAISDTGTIDTEINKLYYVMRNKIEDNNLSYALRKKEDLLALLNKRKIIVKSVSDFNVEISQLEDEKLSLTSKLDNITETVKSPVAGYFYTEIDGYEDIFSSEKVSNLTLEEFNEMKNSSPDGSLISNSQGYSAGKLIVDFGWYIACEIDEKQLRHFEQGNSYDVIFPYSSDEKITMKLDRLISQTDETKTILIFQTGMIPPNFNYLRRQTVEIIQKNYEGYKVPSSAVRIIDNKEGVYVLNGNTIKFKEITPLLEQDGYMIVAKQDILYDPEYFNKLSLYDLIIVRGKGLSDEKVIE